MRPSRGFPLLLVVFAGFLSGCDRPDPVDPRLQAPIELAAAARPLGLRKIFTNPRARGPLRELSLAPAAPDPRDAASLQSPSLWRRQDRQHRYDAVLLAGPAGEFQPLLKHLAGSPDFRLVRVDNWGVLFVRQPSAAFTPPTPSAVAKDLARDDERGIYLSQMALMLEAVGQRNAARAFSAAAIDEAPREPSVQVGTAALALARKDYSLALNHAQRALELRPNDLGALEITARTLAAAGAADQAWVIARELKSRASGDDMNVLFLHARLANAAHAYGDEQTSLEKLIALAEKQNLPAGDYRVYLGQSYAHQGLARPALEQLERAARDPDLTPEQRADLDTAITTVRSRAGRLSD